MSWELLLHYAHPLVTSFSCIYFSGRVHISYQHLLFIWTKNMFYSLWNHWLPPDLQCLSFSFRTDDLLVLHESQIGLGIISRPQSVESTFKELFSVTVFSSIPWDSLWERCLLLFFLYRGENRRLGGVSKRFFFSFPNNCLGQTLLCKLLATLNSICKILWFDPLLFYLLIYLSLYLSNLSLVYFLSKGNTNYQHSDLFPISEFFYHQLEMCLVVYFLWESVTPFVNQTLYFHFRVFMRINWNNKENIITLVWYEKG